MNRLIRTQLTGKEELRLAAYFVVVAALGIYGMFPCIMRASMPHWVAVLMFGVAGLLAYNAVFVLPSGVRMMPGTPVIMTALYVYGIPLALLTVVPSLLLHFFTRRNGLLNCLFNVGQLSISLLAAAWVGSMLGWAPGVNLDAKALVVLPVMVFVLELVNYGLVAAAVAIEHRQPYLPWLRKVGYEDRAYAIPTTYAATIISALLTHYMGPEGAIVVLAGVFALFTQSRLLKEYATKAEESLTDALTGLYNLRYLEDWMQKHLTPAHDSGVVSVLFVDVDGLKNINDTYGHAAGDSVLVQIGAYLMRRLGKNNVIRYGGDEFVLLCHDLDTSGAVEFARSTLNDLKENPPVYNGMPVNCGLSYGIATFPVHSTTGRELVRLADRAMYLAKKRGGNSVFIADAL